ncbi:MAG TPA: hypothetical protein PLO37_19215 [Candidatus Hydrogenedentes bacterium]|nr:hypothetical protein [Candidatus Hydrogenedentota bacterium]HPG68982.1 hypothetical protein [Candidatus Hydrogenedentota bacterium]
MSKIEQIRDENTLIRVIVQCCQCKRVREDGEWVGIPAPEVAKCVVSHGYCPECAAQAFEELHELLGAGAECEALSHAVNG